MGFVLKVLSIAETAMFRRRQLTGAKGLDDLRLRCTPFSHLLTSMSGELNRFQETFLKIESC